MSPTDEMNPYAPSSHAADPALAERPAIGGRVSSTSLCFWTMGACTVAGGLFGLATLIFLVASSLLFDADRANMAPLVDITIFAGYGIVVGGVLAFVSSIPSVMLAFVVGMPWRKADHQWDSKAIGRFAAVSGLLSGFLPLPVASGLDPSAFLFALLPAIFGSITARLLIIPLARKARERPEPLSSQLPGNYAGG